MTKRRLCLSALFVGGVIVAAPLAQQRASPPQRPPAPTFRSTTQYLAVDLLVTDNQDRIVRDLTKADFTATQAGVLQPTDDHSFVEVPLATQTGDAIPPPPPP